MRQKISHKLERGQAIILIAAAAIGLIAMVGLMVDGGIMLIEYGRLKRAIDAASLSAALQYREGYTIDQLTNAAQEFLQLNQSSVFDIQIDTDDTDASLLTEPRRKLVRVTASRHIQFGFLRVVGIYGTDLSATSVGEAASVDVVIVLDTSAAMAFEGEGIPTTGDGPADDPSQCNPADTCEPLRSIKDVAIQFVNQLYFPYDRVSIITFDRNANLIMQLDATNGMTGPDAKAAVIAAIDGLNVFQPQVECRGPTNVPEDYWPAPNCLNYPDGTTYGGLSYPLYLAGPDGVRFTSDDRLDSSSVPSSNIGDALWLAGDEFGLGRQDSLWVTILLSGGPANTGCFGRDCGGQEVYPYRICPPSTWVTHYCRDDSTATRHASTNSLYDADDYARDAADFLANPLTGQGATIFSIGLGDPMDPHKGGATSGGPELMSYAALTAGDESGDNRVNHGDYYYAPDAAALVEIFRKIAENIATRLSQ